MLPKQKRLTRSEFERVFSAGNHSHTPLFHYIWTQDPLFKGKYSVVVSKKNSPGAVERVSSRRKVYKELENFTDIKKGALICIVKKPLLTTPTQEIYDDLETCIARHFKYSKKS